MFKIANGYDDFARNMFFKLKEGSRTRRHKAALVKEQCRLDMRKYSLSQRAINEWNKLTMIVLVLVLLICLKIELTDIYRAGYT